MDDSLFTFTIADVLRTNPQMAEYAIGNDFLLCGVNGSEVEASRAALRTFMAPIRFDGYFFMYCLKGKFKIDINLNTYEIHPNTAFINIPGNIARIADVSEDKLEDFDFVFILVSKEFMSSIRFDFSQSFKDSVRIMQTPVLRLEPEQFEIGADYYRLARKILRSPLSNRREIIGSLISSLTYMSVDLWQNNPAALPQESRTGSNRLNMIFDRFIALVTEYHCTERNMAFYADKLCLTPKYLSKLIKQASGRSAPDWIDAFVILEAKNMLKYSSISIKEIVFKLNFPNQSVFYKFFKSHTGMTPSEYRNG